MNTPDSHLANLTKKLNANTSLKMRSVLLPPETGIIFAVGPICYRVSAINAGKMRFSAEFYGVITADGGIMRPGGEVEYQQKAGQNVTLDVQHGSISADAIFGPRNTAGQNQVTDQAQECPPNSPGGP